MSDPVPQTQRKFTNGGIVLNSSSTTLNGGGGYVVGQKSPTRFSESVVTKQDERINSLLDSIGRIQNTILLLVANGNISTKDAKLILKSLNPPKEA